MKFSLYTYSFGLIRVFLPIDGHKFLAGQVSGEFVSFLSESWYSQTLECHNISSANMIYSVTIKGKLNFWNGTNDGNVVGITKTSFILWVLENLETSIDIVRFYLIN